jgi:hypothetical protein
MIVWIASFPRSGNTFFRIVLHALYSVSTYSGFLSGDDLEGDLGRPDMTGHSKLPRRSPDKNPFRHPAKVKRLIEVLEAEDKVYFIKTHALPSELWGSQSKAILLVRDGRDAAVSFSKYMLDTANTWSRWRKMVSSFVRNGDYVSLSRTKVILTRTYRTCLVWFARRLGFEDRLHNYLLKGFLTNKGPWSGRWSVMNAEWMDRNNAQTTVIHFEELIRHPHECIKRALSELQIELPHHDADIPNFDELKRLHPRFFRSGKVDEWKSAISSDLNEDFWRCHGNMMLRLGYSKGGRAES